MQKKDYKAYFDKIDAELLKISPRKDIMLLRVIASIIPVVCFGLDALYGMPVLYWLGIPFYLFCLGIYLESFLKAALLMRKVSAELLIVLVMVVTLIDGEPLSGAMMAWFIGLGLYISFTIIRKNRDKIFPPERTDSSLRIDKFLFVYHGLKIIHYFQRKWYLETNRSFN